MKLALFDPSYGMIINMKYIYLNRGKKTQVDDSDYDWLSSWKWSYDNGYVHRGIWDKSVKKVKKQYLARLIMGNPDGMVDHINGDTLDNRKQNLRVVTPSQNSINKKIRKDSRTGVKGIRYRWQYKLWQARISKEGKRVSLGHFKTKEEAIRAYNDAVSEWHGEYAR